MRHYIIATLFLFPFCTATSAQKLTVTLLYSTSIENPENRFIYYTPGLKLNIDDFVGNPVAGSEAVAITNSGFAFKLGYKNSQGKASLNMMVYCNFDKQSSWMKSKGKNEYILTHEQHHLDISYICCQRFIKKVKEANFTVSNYDELVKKLYNNAIADMQQLQHQYDSETMNGQLKEKQYEWNEKIDAMVKSL
jgi:FtsZ-binding cell division protein ZapB